MKRTYMKEYHEEKTFIVIYEMVISVDFQCAHEEIFFTK